VWISRLSLTNFRNYPRLELDLGRGTSIFWGNNAQGKTNLIESIWALSTTKSHRANNERELINHAAVEDLLPVSRIFAQAKRGNTDHTEVELILRLDASNGHTTPSTQAPTRKQCSVNGVGRRAIDVMGQIKTVMFSAEDIDLVSGAPSLRRRHLDMICCQGSSRYRYSLGRYQKVLWQRNHLLSLLQQQRAHINQLEFWDKELVQYGAHLIFERKNLVTALNRQISPIHDELTEGVEHLDITYVPSIGHEEYSVEGIAGNFQQALSLSQAKEIAQGASVIGPHRDDLRFHINGLNMNNYGSRGQQRTIILALKLAEAQYFQMQDDDPPVLLLDDMLPELDKHRRYRLLELITPFEQVLITATEPDFFKQSFLTGATQFQVHEGTVEQAAGLST